MEINLFDLSKTSKERAAWDGLTGQAVCAIQHQPASQGQSKPLKEGTLSQATERCTVVVTFTPDRQTQIFKGQNGKEIADFPLTSSHESHESQELQRGSTEADLQDMSQQHADAWPSPKAYP